MENKYLHCLSCQDGQELFQNAFLALFCYNLDLSEETEKKKAVTKLSHLEGKAKKPKETKTTKPT